MKTKQLLESMRVPGDANTYVLGSFDHRITIYSQQVRALNLAFALLENGLLEGKRLGIIGGGVAGMTLSAAAMRFGAHVSLFEKREEWLALQRNSQRWVHPHIYDWPFDGSESDAAALPFLDWFAGNASDVVGMMLASWNIERNAAARRFVEQRSSNLNTAGQQIIEGEDARGLRIQGDFDSIVLTVGFGDECSDWGTPSYWRTDDLAEGVDKETRYLISGCGDGGLCDLLRIALRDSDPRLLARKMAAPGLADLRREVCDLEQRASDLPDESSGDALLGDYFDELRKRHGNLAGKMLGERRHRNRVTLNGRGKSPYSRRASALNRTLAAMLDVPYLPGGELTVCRLADGRFKVDDGNRSQVFDRYIERRGPRSALQQHFRKTYDACLPKMGAIARLDITRERLFPADWARRRAKHVPMFDPSGRRVLVDSTAILSDAALGLDRELILSELRRRCASEHSWFAVLHGDGRQSLGLLLYRLLHEFMVRPPTDVLRHDVFYVVNEDLHRIANGEEWLLAIEKALPGNDDEGLAERLAGVTRYGPVILIIGAEPFRSGTGTVDALIELLTTDLIEVLDSTHRPIRVLLAIESDGEQEPAFKDSVQQLLDLVGHPLLPHERMSPATFPTPVDVASYCRSHDVDRETTRLAVEQLAAIAAATTKNFKDAVDALDKITGNKR